MLTKHTSRFMLRRFMMAVLGVGEGRMTSTSKAGPFEMARCSALDAAEEDVVQVLTAFAAGAAPTDVRIIRCNGEVLRLQEAQERLQKAEARSHAKAPTEREAARELEEALQDADRLVRSSELAEPRCCRCEAAEMEASQLRCALQKVCLHKEGLDGGEAEELRVPSEEKEAEEAEAVRIQRQLQERTLELERSRFLCEEMRSELWASREEQQSRRCRPPPGVLGSDDRKEDAMQAPPQQSTMPEEDSESESDVGCFGEDDCVGRDEGAKWDGSLQQGEEEQSGSAAATLNEVIATLREEQALETKKHFLELGELKTSLEAAQREAEKRRKEVELLELRVAVHSAEQRCLGAGRDALEQQVSLANEEARQAMDEVRRLRRESASSPASKKLRTNR